MAMFSSSRGESLGFFARTVWRLIWLIQIGLWLCLAFLILHHWLIEAPAVRRYLDSGLAQGFDALAGVVASRAPSWQEVNAVTGRAGEGGYSFLQGDGTFKVWKELDELPTWNAGLAGLCYNQSGKLLWVRRYDGGTELERPEKSGVASKIEYVENKASGELFPVVRPPADQGGVAP
jgi:hypothetical protein